MKLTIIVPVYNMVADGKLEFCLQSLMHQNLDDFEVIAVDDKSTDRSLQVLSQWKRDFPQILTVIASPENKKQGGAKNLGLAIAKGEYVGFVDSDDWIAADMYRKLLDKAKQTNADCVGCDYSLVQEHTMKVGAYIQNNSAIQLGAVTEERQRQMILNPGSMVIKIYKRTLFTKYNIQFPEHIFYEDNAIGANVLLHAKNFQRVEEALYYYYQHDTSTVHTITQDRCEDRMKAAILGLQEYKKQGFDKKYRDEIEYKFFELYYKNTLFSYLQHGQKTTLEFIQTIRQGFLEQNINIIENKYYQQYTDKENKKLIKLHLKSNFLFYCYYKILHSYRKIRYGK